MSVAARTALVAVMLLVPCDSSTAATVSRFGDVVLYIGASRDASSLTISANDAVLVFSERRERVLVGEGCRNVARRTAECDRQGVGAITVVLGNGDDELTVAPSVAARLVVSGGRGDDVLRGSAQPDEVSGGRGDDVLDGGDGGDIVRGGPGNDDVAGSGGDDLLAGGGGDDDIQALDGGQDEIDCGRGFDSANSGSSDRFVWACDVIRRTSVTSTACDAGTASTRLKPQHPKQPPRKLQVRVTGSNRPRVAVRVDIRDTANHHDVEQVSPVKTDGTWHFVRNVGTKYWYSYGTPRCGV